MTGPGLALAHLVTTGLGPFYDGIVHFVRTPQDVLSVLALALFAGLRGAAQGRGVLLALPASWLAGGVAGIALHGAPGAAAAVATTASMLICGILVAADARLPLDATVALSAVIGLLHGFENAGVAAQPAAALLELIGAATATFVLCALAAARVASLRSGWARIAVRVAGSWISAIGLLVLGWSLRSAR